MGLFDWLKKTLSQKKEKSKMSVHTNIEIVENKDLDLSTNKSEFESVYQNVRCSQLSISQEHFSDFFLFQGPDKYFYQTGIDRRNGDIWLTMLKKENGHYKGCRITKSLFDTIIFNIASPFTKEDAMPYLGLNSDNWTEYAFFYPGKTYRIHESSYEDLGCGMHYGTVSVYVDLIVGFDGYHFSPASNHIPFGFFSEMPVNDIKEFMYSIITSDYGVREPSCDMIELAYKLKDTDAFISTHNI